MRLLLLSAFLVSALGCDAGPDESRPQAAAAASGEITAGGDTAVSQTSDSSIVDDLSGPAAQPGEPAVIVPATPVGASGPGAAPLEVAAVPAQEDASATLRRAARAYETVRTMQADFVMQFENPLIKQKMSGRGRLYQQRPDRIALRFSQPAGDMIIGDGDYFYVYYRDVDPTQATRTSARSLDGNSVDLQAQFLGDPVERFNHRLLGVEPIGGRPARILLLEPRSQGQFRSLKVWIDDKDSLARRFEITEHNGSVRRFDLDNLRVNDAIPDATFRFTAPAGVRVITVG